jgi:hypothetical protein
MAKKKNEISVSEFKSWISGIQDMQEDDWTPNKQQWEKIRGKIDMLAETEAPEVVAPAQQPYQTYTPNYQYTPPAAMPTFPANPTPVPTTVSPITYSDGEPAAFI